MFMLRISILFKTVILEYIHYLMSIIILYMVPNWSVNLSVGNGSVWDEVLGKLGCYFMLAAIDLISEQRYDIVH